MLSRPRRPGSAGRATQPETAPVQVLDHIPMPAALLDAGGRILSLNPAWEDAAQPGGIMAATDAVGSDYLRALRAEKGFNLEAGRNLADAITSVLEGQKPKARHPYTVQTDGQEAAWEATVSRIGSGDDAHVLIVHRDRSGEAALTALRARVDELSVERERQHAVQEDRGRLIHQAQQGFHGPMTPVRLQLHLLRQESLGRLGDRQKAAVEQIERNVQRLWNLQEELLADLLALEATAATKERTDLSALFEEALHPFRARCIEAGVRLRVDRTDDALPVHVDVRSLVQALLVLLDHAIRATASGGLVWVRLRHVRGRAEIAIQDQDPTMGPALAHALLAEDGAEDPLRAVLHHVQAVLERNDGTVRTHCAGSGHGLEVTLRLPLD